MHWSELVSALLQSNQDIAYRLVYTNVHSHMVLMIDYKLAQVQTTGMQIRVTVKVTGAILNFNCILVYCTAARDDTCKQVGPVSHDTTVPSITTPHQPPRSSSTPASVLLSGSGHRQ